jgi:hypothetical protein
MAGQKGERSAVDCLSGKSALPFDLNSGFRSHFDGGKILLWDQADLPCPVLPAKRNLFRPDPKDFYNSPRLVPLEGRIAIVTDAGRDAVDADAPLTNGAEADGEGVWS